MRTETGRIFESFRPEFFRMLVRMLSKKQIDRIGVAVARPNVRLFVVRARSSAHPNIGNEDIPLKHLTD